MSNEYQYGGFVKHYPHLLRKDLPYEERINLYTGASMSDTEKQKCPCGRSPLGKCIGLHKLEESEYRAWLVSQMGPTNSEGEE